MPWVVSYDEQHHLVRIKNTDEINLAEIKEATRAAVSKAEQHGAKAYLIDNSEITVELNPSSIVQLVKFYDQIGLSRQNRAAIIAPTGSGTDRNLRFLETAARNRGYPIRLYSSEEEAIDWLTSEPGED